MEGIQADLAVMPLANIIALFTGAALLCAVIAVIIKRLGISSIGPIKREQEGQTSQHFMDEENGRHDWHLKQRCQTITSGMRTRMVNLLRHDITCVMTRRALASAIRMPLYTSVINNHFTEVLMPNKLSDYKQRIIGSIKDEYDDIYYAALDSPCGHGGVKPWADIAGFIETFVDDWIEKIKIETAKTCEDKIDVYQKYLPNYQRDPYRREIVEGCIKKNRDYLVYLTK
jgi:hypothetical protein